MKKAWEVAQAPVKNLLMMGFMMWMAGSTVHLFSIGITFSALWQPISALQGVGKEFAIPYCITWYERYIPIHSTLVYHVSGEPVQLRCSKFYGILDMTMFLLAVFEPYKDPRVDTLAPKLLFIALNLAGLVLGIWKVKL
ncbi:hypothetical protein B296_00022800 [Ensete ventricosum]|uniref:ER membrane protein complex subunit 4 n=1 Tax=Ensete ventricosum TaxID=4639 RepID=A0A426ZIE0_ENSVE|nr:hypothetical protein B296_00022800 [Ensete ventricosum]